MSDFALGPGSGAQAPLAGDAAQPGRRTRTRHGTRSKAAPAVKPDPIDEFADCFARFLAAGRKRVPVQLELPLDPAGETLVAHLDAQCAG